MWLGLLGVVFISFSTSLWSLCVCPLKFFVLRLYSSGTAHGIVRKLNICTCIGLDLGHGLKLDFLNKYLPSFHFNRIVIHPNFFMHMIMMCIKKSLSINGSGIYVSITRPFHICVYILLKMKTGNDRFRLDL